MAARRKSVTVKARTTDPAARANFDTFAARLRPYQFTVVAGPPGPRYPYTVMELRDPETYKGVAG